MHVIRHCSCGTSHEVANEARAAVMLHGIIHEACDALMPRRDMTLTLIADVITTGWWGKKVQPVPRGTARSFAVSQASSRGPCRFISSTLLSSMCRSRCMASTCVRNQVLLICFNYILFSIIFEQCVNQAESCKCSRHQVLIYWRAYGSSSPCTSKATARRLARKCPFRVPPPSRPPPAPGARPLLLMCADLRRW